MKLLLTSAGITNASIRDALVELLGKPVEEANALCIPTATHCMPGGADLGWRFISGNEPRTPMVELGWRTVGVLELTALPSIDRDIWVSRVEEADVLLVGGGDTLYLCRWMRESGLADLLPTLQDIVYVGFSAGSCVLTPSIGEALVLSMPPGGSDETLGLVDFSIFPHVDHPDMPPGFTMADAQRWAAGMRRTCYVIDDSTAIKVVDGQIDVVSEGTWRLLTP
ncbi:MAG TPA: Type 1 glutamine amidotransferase-like domain-containing protein [Mycobacteriales bacterium]|nr:Type 1 glutamine amidotransferase-like domain-containing protein [Mycobacteriales bacterium]HVW80568.1 Type 1 glutamine amidotransferase-like domain-containing protein [Mycobacteriales bacterium]